MNRTTDPFLPSKKLLGYGSQQSQKKQDLASHSPDVFWCGHYLDPQTKQPIPDGAPCCFNHWVGLPTRWGQRHPIYPEQMEMVEATLKHKLIAIEKEPKRGVTELYLRMALWLATKDDAWKDGQVCIVVATNVGEAETMIQRAKDIIQHKISINDNYNTRKEFSINNCLFKAIPANNIDALRSKTNMRLILVDESSFFKMVEQQRVRDAVEHYLGGANVMIAFVSTAGESPEGIMYEIMHVEQDSIYHRIITNYEDGLVPHPESGTTIFSPEGIEQARKLRSWSRNYLHSWHSGEGDIFTHEDVDACYDDFDRMMDGGTRVIAIDPAYGSSNFGVVIGVLKGDKLYVVFAKEYHRPTPTFMVNEVARLYRDYNCSLCLCDGHYSGEIRDLKDRQTNTVPFEFNTESKSNMVNSSSSRVIAGKLKIHRTLKDLGGQMKAAKADIKGHLDKKIMNLDMLECLCMICERFKTSSIKILKV